jgi:hypothetical protein
MRKSNNKLSQHKAKRALKNKKRIQDKPYKSKHELKLERLREQIIMGAFR